MSGPRPSTELWIPAMEVAEKLHMSQEDAIRSAYELMQFAQLSENEQAFGLVIVDNEVFFEKPLALRMLSERGVA